MLKVSFLAILLGILVGGNLLAVLPQEHEPPAVYCSPNQKDVEHRCTCVNQDPERCSNGKSNRERPPDGRIVCKHDCYMAMCACCLS